MLAHLEASFVNESHSIPRNCRNDEDQSLDCAPFVQRSCLTSDNKYVLLWKGSILEVLCRKPKQLTLIGTFNFATLTCDKSVHISCVAELKEFANEDTSEAKSPVVAVALNRKVGGSIICLIDLWLNRVLKCIETPFRVVTIISMVLMNSPIRNVLPLADELKAMCGIVCVGTEGGLVAFIDLCLDKPSQIVDFLVPNKVKFIVKESNTLKNTDLCASRSVAIVNDQHLCLPLNSESQHKGKFVYRSHDGSVLAKFQSHNVFISSLEYIFQTNTICVGFNFGGFQLWCLKSLMLECSCSLDNDLLPVVKFAFQEPENDPKNYCFLWVVRGIEAMIDADLRSEISEPSAAFLYTLVFSKKQWAPGFGYLYSNFEMCVIRFEYCMTTNSDSQGGHSQMKSCFISCDTLYQGSQSSKQYDDENVTIDSSLCSFSWEVWNAEISQSLVYFAIFDLNQWYQCQMPSFISLSASHNLYSPFFGLYSLTDVCNVSAPDIILNTKVIADSITAFRPRNNYSDISYYPVSLSFDIVVVTENRVLSANYLGLQKRCLSQIMVKGANVLVDPSDAIRHCVDVGLLLPDTGPDDVAAKRETILTLALQNSHLPFITEIIQQWSSDELSYIGCNCKFILDWIWKHVSVIKASLDKLTEPLFSFGQHLSEDDLDVLNSYEIDLKALSVLLKNLQLLGTPTTEQGLTELNTRIEVAELINTYLRILLWLYGCGLLPEHLEGEPLENEVVYPKVALTNAYESRRTDLSSINPSQINKTGLLMIDGIIDQLPSISLLWQQANGSGNYPPPTIHSLIGVYLLESLPLELKHFVMLYFLFDMTTFLSDSHIEVTEKLKLFPAAFHLKPGITKLVQGMWALDHKFFDFAVTTLCDPVVKNAFCDDRDNISSFYCDLQQRIVTSFLYQHQYRQAMQFMTTCNLFITNSPLKEKIHVSILLSNNKILDAFRFQRCCRNDNNAEDILLHFFLACEEMNLMEKLFKMPLDNLEEDALIYYLMHISRNKNHSKHLLVLYFLFNNKIVDASNFISMLGNDVNVADEEFVNRSNQLSVIIHSYLSSLPATLSQLATEINVMENEKAEAKKKKSVVFGGQPKIVKATHSNEQLLAHSDVVRCVMEQIEDVCEKNKRADDMDTNVTPFRQRILENGLLLTQNSPFIRPPVVVESELRTVKDSFYVSTRVADLKSSTDGTPRRLESVKFGESSHRGSSLFSLLDTPPVKRMNIAETTAASCSESYYTPTSILKVKNMLRSCSPSFSKSVKPFSKEKNVKTKLRFSIPSSQLAVEPKSPEILQSSQLEYDLIDFSLANVTDMEMQIDSEVSIANNFVFSPPILSPGNKPTQPSTPSTLPSFVFSPPLTRSRSKQRRTTASVMDQSDSMLLASISKESPDAKSVSKRSVRHSMQLRTSSTKKNVSTED